MEWLIFVLVCWVAVRFLGVGRTRRGRWAGRRLRGRPPEPQALPPKPVAAPETAEQRLRREYVEGTLTVEQYERELDRLYRSGS